MGLEDLALFRSVPGSTVLYPSDPYATEKLAEAAVRLNGVVYFRTTREPTPVIYTSRDEFQVGGSYTHSLSRFNHNSNLKESITIISAGITLHEALKAQKVLAEKGTGCRVIDCYSVKPVDIETLKKAATETRAIVVVEDHYPEGGLGDAVRSALAGSKTPVYHLAVSKLPHSGSAEELLRYEGIDSVGIMDKVESIIRH
jgi:transketolase